MQFLVLWKIIFLKYVDYKFTSDLENNLDKISLGKFDKIKYLNDFYLGENGLLKKTEEGKSKIDANECRSVYLPQLKKNQEIKIGKYGRLFSFRTVMSIFLFQKILFLLNYPKKK